MAITPLFPIYQKYQAKVIDFHGWKLPLQFSSIIREHMTVRQQVGLFDVSHMGEIIVEGPDAVQFLNFVLTNEISTLKTCRVRYSPLCADNGSTLDDLLVYCFESTRFLLVVNASNIDSDYHWLQKNSTGFNVVIKNISDQTAELAVQGPNALSLLQKISDSSIQSLKFYQFIPQIMLANQIPALISRTGYTGEDGFEIYLQPEYAIEVWELIIKTGTPLGILPVGLGARDTLRFEASLPLYGNELTRSISPLEVGLERFVRFEKPAFLGKDTLFLQKTTGTPRSLIGIEMVDRGIPRSGCEIYFTNKSIGYVTSGNYCPFLSKNMALALVEVSTPAGKLGTELQIDIRGNLLTGRVVDLPFYLRK
jgi:aminomethyltransferase